MAYLRSNGFVIAALLFLSLLIHFSYYSHPLTVVLDEVYYGRFTMYYLKHQFFFDLHPPLAKLLLYWVALISHLDPSFTFPENMAPFPNDSYLVLRILPRLVGTLLPLVIYGIARELAMHRVTAIAISLLLMLDNALLVLSRFILLDLFILFFGFTGIWCYLRFRRTGRYWNLIAAAFLVGAAFTTKWTGLSFCGIVGVLEIQRIIVTRQWRQVTNLLLIVAIPVALYYACFAMHFALANRTGSDDWVMSPAFQATLVNSVHYNPANPALSFFEKFNELNQKMFETARTMSGEHTYNSKWYSWPFMYRGMDFWANYTPTARSHIYLLGNPWVWWASTYVMLMMLVNFVPKLVHAWQVKQWLSYAECFLLLGWGANMLPFLTVNRGLFLYHYMPALVFAVLAIGVALDRFKYRNICLAVLVVVAGAGFIYFAPLSYGWLLSPEALEQRFWFESWK